MANVRIVTDSACDIPADIAAAHGITIVPLFIRFGEHEFVDRSDLTSAQFWEKVAQNKDVLPQTAAPSPGAFETAFRRAALDGCSDVVCINLSGRLSGTIEAAHLAARAVADIIPVSVVDSHSVTMGLGTQAIEAAKMANRGLSAAEIVAATESLSARTRVFGALDTLDNLKKGGRIGSAAALVGSLLAIKPILDISTGVVEEYGKQRTRGKSLQYLATLVNDLRVKHGHIENLCVVHGAASDIDDFVKLLTPTIPRAEITVSYLGAVVGSHAGPGIVGISFNTPLGSKA